MEEEHTKECMENAVLKEGFFAETFPVNKAESAKMKIKELPVEVGEVSETFQCAFENSGIMKDGTIYTMKTVPNYHGKQITLGDVMETGQVEEQYFIPEEKLYYTDPTVTHSDETEQRLPKEDRQTWQYLKGAKKLLRTSSTVQDDIDAIDAMLTAFQNGNDIVYGVRASRKQDSAFKRATAQGYYRLLRALGADVVYNHADYRLMSRRALDALAEYKEVNLFLRGLVPLVGYPSTVVYYERGKRFAGESKYPLRKMLSFAWEGVSSLTVSPLRLITRIGIVMFLVSIAMLIYFLVRYFTGHTVAGWSSLAVSIWAIGGLQLLAIGVVGEYIGKIYLETKARPRYRIETELDDREAEL